MKLLLILLPLYLIAWDCSKVINENNMSPQEFCRGTAVIVSVAKFNLTMDKSSFKLGNLNKTTRIDLYAKVAIESEECYQSCLKANKRY